MFKGFIKFNGYTMAICCINYAVTRMLETNVEGSILEKVPFLSNILAPKNSPPPMYYIGFFVACVILLLGIFFECKVLMIPFIAAYVIVIREETSGTFMLQLWEFLYTVYAAISMLLLLMLGICSWCRGKDDEDRQEGSRCRTGCWRFFCCGTGIRCCWRRNKDAELQSQCSHCSCDTLNIRLAGPDDKHYHRVVFEKVPSVRSLHRGI